MRLAVPNTTFASQLEGVYRDSILGAFQAIGSPKASVRCRVSQDGETPPPSPDAGGSPSAPGGPSGRNFDSGGFNGGAERAPIHSEPLRPSFGFDSFVVGPSNRCAHAAALSVSDPEVENSPYNPLLIYGDACLGKTHLLQSIARRLREQNPDRRILYTKGEAFTRQVVQAVRAQQLYSFRDECSALDMLLVDDFEFIAGLDRFGRSTEEFFHALNALSDSGHQVVLTATRHPRDIENLDTRIRSRLESGLITDVRHPDWAMRVAIVTRKAAALGLELPDGLAETIASRHRHVSEIKGTLKSLSATSTAEGVQVSSELLTRVLALPSSPRTRRPSIQQVLMAVAAAFGVPPLRLTGPQRSQEIVLARHSAMYLCRELTGRTLKEIGAEFRRDHSTVTHGCHRIAERRGRDLGLDRLLEKLAHRLS